MPESSRPLIAPPSLAVIVACISSDPSLNLLAMSPIKTTPVSCKSMTLNDQSSQTKCLAKDSGHEPVK